MFSLPPTNSTSMSKKPGPWSSLVGKPDGNGVAALAEPAGLAPVDLVQELIVDPWPGVVGKLACQKKSEHGFAFLDVDVTDRTAEVIRFPYPEDCLFSFICLAGPKVAHLDVALARATAGMKPWLEIDAQDLVGNFPSIDFLGAIHPDASGRAGMEVDGGDPGDLLNALLLGQGDNDLFLSLGQLARPIVPLDPTGFHDAGHFLGFGTGKGDSLRLPDEGKGKHKEDKGTALDHGEGYFAGFGFGLDITSICMRTPLR